MDNPISSSFTPSDEYLTVVAHSQIISVDLLIFDSLGRLLLGKRTSEPARDSLFVPGGRVQKNETFPAAIDRVSRGELGMLLPAGKLTGIYHHLYSNNFDNDDFGTHYVVFAHTFVLEPSRGPIGRDTVPDMTGDSQHSEFVWMSVEDVLRSPAVHLHVKNYFHPAPWNRIA